MSRRQGGPAKVLRGASSNLGMLKKDSSARPIRQASVSRGGPARVLKAEKLYQAHTPSLCVQVPKWPSEGCSTRPIRQASVSRWQGGPAGVLRGASSSLGMLKKDGSARPIRQAFVSRCQAGLAGVLRGASSSASLSVQMARWPSGGPKQQSWNAKKR